MGSVIDGTHEGTGQAKIPVARWRGSAARWRVREFFSGSAEGTRFFPRRKYALYSSEEKRGRKTRAIGTAAKKMLMQQNARALRSSKYVLEAESRAWKNPLTFRASDARYLGIFEV